MGEPLTYFWTAFQVKMEILSKLIELWINIEQYYQIWMHNATSTSGKHLIGNGLLFEHDNDPKHATNAVKAYLDRKKYLMEQYQSRIYFRSIWTSNILKLHGIILAKNEIKGSWHPKKRYRMSFKKPGQLFLKTSWSNDRKTFQRVIKLYWIMKVELDKPCFCLMYCTSNT